jgi:hypothetical protein
VEVAGRTPALRAWICPYDGSPYNPEKTYLHVLSGLTDAAEAVVLVYSLAAVAEVPCHFRYLSAMILSALLEMQIVSGSVGSSGSMS